MISRNPFSILIISCAMMFSGNSVAQSETAPLTFPQKIISIFFVPQDKWDEGFKQISDDWRTSYTPMAIEMLSLSRGEMAFRFVDLLKQKTKQDFGADPNDWFEWWWQQEVEADASYPEFKSQLFGNIDKKFEGYFSTDRPSRIRLDEVRWGGVKQDGIPPLRQPNMVSVKEASYLQDDNIVFGIDINGDARAYPKRILAWHEMFIDEIGGTEFAGVYCTLCGAVILYKTHHEGVRHQLGTSGFLYRSNKVMYDQDTQSLWNTTWGEPVIGPLVGKNIRLERSYLVTTTWGEWKRRHPETTVLSIETGYRRDYGEGIAYNSYFATDDLMFSISTSDSRLKNKDEVLALTFPDHSKKSMAIAADYLSQTPIYSNALDDFKFVVLTDTSGANRVFETGDNRFVKYDQDISVIDDKDQTWTLSEDGLRQGDVKLERLAAHRAFWFGWHAAFPGTVLIQ
jgi:hypothetical protein